MVFLFIVFLCEINVYLTINETSMKLRATKYSSNI